MDVNNPVDFRGVILRAPQINILFSLSRFIDKDIELAADLAFLDILGYFLLQGHQGIQSLPLDSTRNFLPPAVNPCAFFPGINERAHPLEGSIADKIHQFLEILFRFTGKSDDKTGPDMRSGDPGADIVDQINGLPGGNAPVHALQ